MLNIDDVWDCASCISDGLPHLVRCRGNLDAAIGRQPGRRLLRISWRYASTDQSGLPPAEVMERMEDFENAVIGELERDWLAIFAYVSTYNGTKEWVAYIQDVQQTCDRVNLALAHYDPFPVELTVEDDPGWLEYKGVAELMRDLRERGVQ